MVGLREAIDNLRARRFEIDTLMLVAAAGAAALGAWAEGALLCFYSASGTRSRARAMGRARRAMKALAELAPEKALVSAATEPRRYRWREPRAGRRDHGAAERATCGRRHRGGGREQRQLRRLSRAKACRSTSEPRATPMPHSPVSTAHLPTSVLAGTINGAGVAEVKVAAPRLTDDARACGAHMVTEAERSDRLRGDSPSASNGCSCRAYWVLQGC